MPSPSAGTTPARSATAARSSPTPGRHARRGRRQRGTEDQWQGQRQRRWQPHRGLREQQRSQRRHQHVLTGAKAGRGRPLSRCSGHATPVKVGRGGRPAGHREITVASRLATFAGPARETGLTVPMIAEPAVVWRAAGALGNQPHRGHDPQLTADHEHKEGRARCGHAREVLWLSQAWPSWL